MANAPSYYIGGHSIQTVGLVFSVDADFSDLLLIIRGEDVGLDLSVDVDSQICLSSSMVRAGLDFLWMQISQICLSSSMVRAGLDFLWMQISQICSSSSVRPLDWIFCGCRF
jgi:hypothetical protein